MPYPRGEGERSKTPYSSYSLILRVFHYPTAEGKGRDPRLPILHTASFSGSFITPLQRGRGEIPDSLFFIQPHSQGLSLPHCRGEGERSQTPYSSYSLILRVFHYPTAEGKGRDPRLPILHTASFSGSFIALPQRGRGEILDSLFFIRPHSQGLSFSYPRGDRGKTTDSLSYIQPHSKRNENRA